MVANTNVSAEVTAAWNEIRGSTASWMVLKLDGAEVSLEKKGELGSSFDDFKAALPEDDARFAVMNLMWDSSDGRKMTKIIFIVYVPDACKVMATKFSYAQAKDGVSSHFSPINKSLQINDRLDLNETEWKEMF
jgi:cofilin